MVFSLTLDICGVSENTGKSSGSYLCSLETKVNLRLEFIPLYGILVFSINVLNRWNDRPTTLFYSIPTDLNVNLI